MKKYFLTASAVFPFLFSAAQARDGSTLFSSEDSRCLSFPHHSRVMQQPGRSKSLPLVGGISSDESEDERFVDALETRVAQAAASQDLILSIPSASYTEAFFSGLSVAETPRGPTQVLEREGDFWDAELEEGYGEGEFGGVKATDNKKAPLAALEEDEDFGGDPDPLDVPIPPVADSSFSNDDDYLSPSELAPPSSKSALTKEAHFSKDVHLPTRAKKEPVGLWQKTKATITSTVVWVYKQCGSLFSKKKTVSSPISRDSKKYQSLREQLAQQRSEEESAAPLEMTPLESSPTIEIGEDQALRLIQKLEENPFHFVEWISGKNLQERKKLNERVSRGEMTQEEMKRVDLENDKKVEEAYSDTPSILEFLQKQARLS